MQWKYYYSKDIHARYDVTSSFSVRLVICACLRPGTQTAATLVQKASSCVAWRTALHVTSWLLSKDTAHSNTTWMAEMGEREL